ncbi:hypothetical protein [Candidatus Xianfuyuplasma coldseepsis]|uniref:Membrane lipoprotein n=1 Tax=Candidatus Xianfuyuplasma coldseepsis TaxID=2782163 RepID=A0A7L7KQY3_9MOLU|nr:hypothetical protein [Xianfuyuplasma coldseepsis]QMS84692.1 hypothetical protein G4Z02_02635 [Xianfuyuplasma coldseepsis]
MIKRISLIGFTTLIVLIIVACGTTAVSETPMATNTSVASLSYVSSGFIDAEVALNEEDETSYEPMFLSTINLVKPDTTTTKVEGEIGYVNIYLDKFKVFLEDGINSIDVDVQETSDNPDYEIMFTYDVEGESYTVYYNYDEENDSYEGVLIHGETTYELVIEDHLKEEEGETKRNLVLTATNEGNSITIDYEEKEEDGESKSLLTVDKDIDGVQAQVMVEMKQEEGSFKVEIQDGENYYNFKAETTDEGTHYKLDYIVDDIEGTAKIDETVDEDGNFIYSYKITEGDVTSTVEKTPPGQDKKSNDSE